MARYEITGGNGRGASFVAIRSAIRQAGGVRVRGRHAFGMSNQPYAVTFAAADDDTARAICKAACRILWPGDESIMANLIAYRYA